MMILQHGFCEYAERYMSAHHNLIPKLNSAAYTIHALAMCDHDRSP